MSGLTPLFSITPMDCSIDDRRQFAIYKNIDWFSVCVSMRNVLELQTTVNLKM